MSSPWSLPALALLAAAALGRPGEGFAAPAAASSLAECRSQIAATPSSLDGYRCFLEQARREQDWESSGRALEALLEAEATRGGASLFLAAVRADRGGEGVVALYRQAAGHFAARGQVAGEVAARVALADELCTRQAMAGAEAEVLRAAILAEGAGEPWALARARLGQARTAMAQEQISKAWALAREAEGMLLPDGPLELRVELFRVLGFLRWAQGENAEARRDFLRSVDLAMRAGDDFTAAMTLYSAAFIEVLQLDQEVDGREEILAPMRVALEAAQEAGNLAAELRCRLMLGQGTAEDEAVEQFRRASELAELLHDFDRSLFATRFYAYALMARSPDRRDQILGLIGKAVGLARERGDLEQVILGQMSLATAAWILKDEARALAAAHAAFDAIERGRSLQRLDEVRARWHSRFGFFYKRVSGWLLEKAAGGSASASEDLEEALRVMESFRGRSYLDVFETAALPEIHDSPRSRHVEVLQGIAAVQSRLRDRDLAEAERRETLVELSRLEAEESALRIEEGQAPDGKRGSYPSPRVSLVELQKALRPGEALITFQLFSSTPIVPTQVPELGSWMALLTRESWTIRSLPDEDDFEAALPIFLGLVERADHSEGAAAARLYEDLFQGVLETLPDTVNRLVLVLDPLMEGAPLGSLRVSSGGVPLAARFELVRVPSIATFLSFRGAPPTSHRIPVLALADPGAERRPDERKVAARSSLLALGDVVEPLPFARREGRRLVRRLRRGSVLRQGGDASESWLKSEDLSRFSILHFGAHAVVDQANPERSAIILAPGDDGEDGLLQARDLPELELDGQLVVLAACRSAAGAVVAGEGAMGLARAFLLGGARTVVASLWSLQDDLAADLFDRFYRHLAEGAEVGTALQAAQRELWQEGIPARGWAGVVVMGDGSLVPVSPVPPAWPIGSILAILAALGLVVAALLSNADVKAR